MALRVTVLKGQPILDESGVASGTVKPGHLVKGVSTIVVHASAGGAAARRWALERDEMGSGIDTAYAASDVVKVGSFAPGMQLYAFVASGQTIVADDFLESNGDGALRKYGSGVIVARALEAVTTTTSTTTKLAVEVM